jgi:hypothetical protein
MIGTVFEYLEIKEIALPAGVKGGVRRFFAALAIEKCSTQR